LKLENLSLLAGQHIPYHQRVVTIAHGSNEKKERSAACPEPAEGRAENGDCVSRVMNDNLW